MSKPNKPAPAVKPANETETAAALAVIISALAESIQANREQSRFAADPEIFDTLTNERAELLAALDWAEGFAAIMKGGSK